MTKEPREVRWNREQRVSLKYFKQYGTRKREDRRSIGFHVVELFSSLQVTARARQRGLKLFDHWTHPSTGRTWDLRNPKDVEAGWDVVLTNRTHMVIYLQLGRLCLDMC